MDDKYSDYRRSFIVINIILLIVHLLVDNLLIISTALVIMGGGIATLEWISEDSNILNGLVSILIFISGILGFAHELLHVAVAWPLTIIAGITVILLVVYVFDGILWNISLFLPDGWD